MVKREELSSDGGNTNVDRKTKHHHYTSVHNSTNGEYRYTQEHWLLSSKTTVNICSCNMHHRKLQLHNV